MSWTARRAAPGHPPALGEPLGHQPRRTRSTDPSSWPTAFHGDRTTSIWPSTTVERTNSARMGTLTPSSTRSGNPRAVDQAHHRIRRMPTLDRGCCCCHERMLPPCSACSQVCRRTGHELWSRIGGTGSTASGRVARCVRRPTHVGTKSTSPTSGSSRHSSALRVCHRPLGARSWDRHARPEHVT
jgi:hypothetical protein